jgi:hypothetical protein
MADNRVIPSDRELFLSQLATKSGNLDINIPQIVEFGRPIEFGPEIPEQYRVSELGAEFILSLADIAESLGFITKEDLKLPINDLGKILDTLTETEQDEINESYEKVLDISNELKDLAFSYGFITQDEHKKNYTPYQIDKLIKTLPIEEQQALYSEVLPKEYESPELTPAESQIELVEEPEGLAEESKELTQQEKTLKAIEVVSEFKGNTGPLSNDEFDKFTTLERRIKEDPELADRLYNKALQVNIISEGRQKDVENDTRNKEYVLSEFRTASPRKARILLGIYEKEAYGLYLGGATAIIISESPKKNIQQLSILIGEMFAGNDSNIIKQEISAILDKLLNEGFISSKEHKKLSRFSQ